MRRTALALLGLSVELDVLRHPEQRWKPFYRWQLLWVTIQAVLFQYSVAIQHLRLDKVYKGKLSKAEVRPLTICRPAHKSTP